MNRKFVLIALLSTLAISANACDLEFWNHSECDDSYTPECVSTTEYQVCHKGKLAVQSCGETSLCQVNEAGVGVCVDTSEPECAYDKFCSDNKVCAEGKCVDPECSVDKPCQIGEFCYNGACLDEPALLTPNAIDDLVALPAPLVDGETAPVIPGTCTPDAIITTEGSNGVENNCVVLPGEVVPTIPGTCTQIDISTTKDIAIDKENSCIELYGETSGTVTITDKKKYGATIKLNNIKINENADGSGLAIKKGDIQNHYVLLLKGNNEITGSANVNTKKALSCSGNLDIVGPGTLNVNAKYKTGVGVDDVLKIYGGTLNINVSRDENVVWEKPSNPEKGFGIKAGNGFEMVGGALNILAHDAVEYKGVEPRGVKVDGTDGAEDDVDCSQENYGAGKGYVKIKGGNIVIQSDAKALSAGWDIEEDTTNDCDHDNPTPDLEISGGNIKIRTMGIVRPDPVDENDEPKLSPEGIEAKNDLTITGGEISVITADDAINAGHDIVIKGGKIIAWSTQNDGIDSNNTLHIEGGQIVTMGMHGRECGLDADYNEDVYYTNGTVMALSGNNNAPQGNGNANFAQVVLGNSPLAGKAIVVTEKDNDNIIAAMQVPAEYVSGNNLVVLSDKIKAGQTYRVLVDAKLDLADGARLFDSMLGIMLDGAATVAGGEEFFVKAGLVPVEPPHGAKPSDEAEKGLD